MTKKLALSEAKYSRELIRLLLQAKTDAEKEEIANELVASVIEIARQLNTPNYNAGLEDY